jgi:hypothetical protein
VKSIALSVSTLLLLTACAAAPTVRVSQVCPKVPMLELNLPEGALEQSFTDRMANFLQGRLIEPISYELHSKPVKLPTITPDAK